MGMPPAVSTIHKNFTFSSSVGMIADIVCRLMLVVDVLYVGVIDEYVCGEDVERQKNVNKNVKVTLVEAWLFHKSCSEVNVTWLHGIFSKEDHRTFTLNTL